MSRLWMKRHLKILLSLCAGFLCSLGVHAELVVITNPQSGVESLSKTQVINIFLGSHRVMPNGLEAMPIDLPASVQEKSLFYRQLVNRDLDQMAAYWSRLIFAGSTQPPRQLENSAQAIEFVATHRGGIAYVERRMVTPAVRVVFSLP